jgi:hypothetical protein
MRCKRRARKIPVLPILSIDYSSKWARAPSKMMAVSSSWGRAARRPRRTRGGPMDPSISERGLEKALGRRCAGQRGDDVDAAAVAEPERAAGTAGLSGTAGLTGAAGLAGAPVVDAGICLSCMFTPVAPKRRASPRPPPTRTWPRCTGPRPTLAPRRCPENAPGRGTL